jgi:hypothetical protein
VGVQTFFAREDDILSRSAVQGEQRAPQASWHGHLAVRDGHPHGQEGHPTAVSGASRALDHFATTLIIHAVACFEQRSRQAVLFSLNSRRILPRSVNALGSATIRIVSRRADRSAWGV